MRPYFAYFLSIAGIGLLFIWSGHDFDPNRELRLIQGSGQLGLGFLFATLSISPISALSRKLFSAKQAAALRRSLGLCTTGFASFHLFLVFQLNFVTEFSALLTEPQWRNGFAAFIVLLLLSLSSFPFVVRRFRIGNWKSLHQLAYAALFFALLHVLVSPSTSWNDLILVLITLLVLILLRLLSYLYRPAEKANIVQD